MAKKLSAWKTRGMNQDLSVSAFNPEFAFENMNLRLSTNEGNTMMSWVNEKGTEKIVLKKIVKVPEHWSKEGEEDVYVDPEDESWTYHAATTKTEDAAISGIPIGTAVLNHKLVVFTTTYLGESDRTAEDFDYIYVVRYLDTDKTIMELVSTVEGGWLYKGNLNFCTKNPLETLVSYEAETIQKVYWTDGKNQPRVINIEASGIEKKLSTYFDFVSTLRLAEVVTVEKQLETSGTFAPGVIQYAFTYYNKYSQESNIFYTTKLFCVAYNERGASPEEKVNCAFKITIDKVDKNFEFLRIYSIQRTSLNAVPICKRVQDIKIETMNASTVYENEKYITFIDSGTQGDSIDPTELLYKGGEKITAKTMEQKDNTLFLGNIGISKEQIPDGVKNSINGLFNPTTSQIKEKTDTSRAILKPVLREVQGTVISTGEIPYVNSIDYSGFKSGEVYRFGIQFQHETGKWSEPLWLRDYQMDTHERPSIAEEDVYNDGVLVLPCGTLKLPQIQVTINDSDTLSPLLINHYKRARLLMAQPDGISRRILCQGIANPTVYQEDKRYGMNSDDIPDHNKKGSLWGQSSWLFRPYWNNNPFGDTTAENGAGYVPATGRVEDLRNLDGVSASTGKFSSPALRSTEIGCTPKPYDGFKIDNDLYTIHTPELIFDDSLFNEDWNGTDVYHAGNALFTSTFGDIDIQTKTPTIGSAQGFIHRPIKTVGNAALVSGLFYEDFIVDDYNEEDPKYNRYPNMRVPVFWPVFMWHRSGSLNNDVNRPARSAELKEKKISNYHVSTKNIFYAFENTPENVSDIQLFQSDELNIIKVDGDTYMGNIDTAISSKEPDNKYFAGFPWRTVQVETFFSNIWMRLGLADPGDTNSRNGFWQQSFGEGPFDITWTNYAGDWEHIGDSVPDLCETSESIRMKYKSTPHLVVKDAGNNIFGLVSGLPIVEVVREYDKNVFYGGQSDDALRANTWIPISEPVDLKTNITLYSNRGDTYYQRFDCLKTYAFTPEDINQVVDIASFMVETHLNIDGRYDRNRGQSNNLNMSPRNYNLYNTVYSQRDNFFSYKMMDEDYYRNMKYLNQITWTKTKENGSDVDLWTNITLASILELDGDKGSISKLIRLNDQLLCFQDTGISQILYNENTQISTTEGVPIEIANSGKVQGKRYLSNTIGCSNKWSMVQTPTGIYFMDSNDKSIYRLGEGLQNISQQAGFNSWCKNNIPSFSLKWAPEFPEENGLTSFRAFYDKLNQDILWVNKDTALAFSEKMGVFSSFYSYGNTPFFENFDDTGVWIKQDSNLWKHRAGDYCKFFNESKPYWMTLVGNPEPQMGKIFTNLEFRASVQGDGIPSEEKDADGNPVKVTPNLPFDFLETWDEYQHGYTTLDNKNGHSLFKHGGDSSALIRKFRIWRCDIPRNNCNLGEPEQGETWPYSTDTELGVSRHIRKPNDRMRNPWLYLKLQKDVDVDKKVEIHDIVMTYYT